MWFQFAICFVLGIVMLLVPGFLLLTALRVPIWNALGFAAPISITWFVLAGIVFDALGMRTSLLQMFLPLVIIVVLLSAVVSVRGKSKSKRGKRLAGGNAAQLPLCPHFESVIITVTIGISLLLGTIFFVKQLDGPASFVQEFDNGWNLSLIQSYANSGIYSVFSLPIYSNVDFIPPAEGASFYPAAWHCLAALLTSALDVPTTLAANALNKLLSFVVFPLGMLSLLFTLFTDNRRCLVFAPALILAFQSFPWRLLEFGPLYSNLSSFSIAPIFLASFIRLLQDGVSLKERILFGFISFVALIDIAFMQPNAAFTCGVMLVPFCVARLCSISPNGMEAKRVYVLRVGLIATFLLFVVLLWTYLYNASFMQPVVTFSWASFLSKRQALANILLCAFSSDYAQPALAALVLSGIAYGLYAKRNRWLIVSYALVIIQYFICATTDGTIKHILTGFWYTDSYRIAASIVYAGIPLACMGAYALYRAAVKLFVLLTNKSGKASTLLPILGFSITLIGLIYYPNYSISLQPVQTAFGMLAEKFSVANSATADNVLTDEEREFLQEVDEVVPDDAVILNQPYDGSAFAYGLYGMNVYYRYFGLNTGSDSDTSIELRLHVDDWESDPDVAQALDDANVQYVLLLDEGDNQGESRRYLPTPWNREEDFSGLYNISEEHAPGFVEVLRDGDMVLYEIQN